MGQAAGRPPIGLERMLRGEEMQMHADTGDTGVERRAEIVALERKLDWQIACKRG